MKKSVVYRTLQVASAVAVLSMLSIWASAKHVDVVSNILTEIDSLLVILAIAVALPYFCFKVLGKLYTPPKSTTLPLIISCLSSLCLPSVDLLLL